MQHRMWEARRELYAWLQDGAVIYVCGDANAMAKDVHATLLRDSRPTRRQDGRRRGVLDAMQREGRYLRDVY